MGHLLGIKVFNGICVYLYYLLLQLSCTIFSFGGRYKEVRATIKETGLATARDLLQMSELPNAELIPADPSFFSFIDLDLNDSK